MSSSREYDFDLAPSSCVFFLGSDCVRFRTSFRDVVESILGIASHSTSVVSNSDSGSSISEAAERLVAVDDPVS